MWSRFCSCWWLSYYCFRRVFVRTIEVGFVDVLCGCLGFFFGSLRVFYFFGFLGMEAAKVLFMDEGENR